MNKKTTESVLKATTKYTIVYGASHNGAWLYPSKAVTKATLDDWKSVTTLTPSLTPKHL